MVNSEKAQCAPQVASAENGDNKDIKTIRKIMERQSLISKAANVFKIF